MGRFDKEINDTRELDTRSLCTARYIAGRLVTKGSIMHLLKDQPVAQINNHRERYTSKGNSGRSEPMLEDERALPNSKRKDTKPKSHSEQLRDNHRRCYHSEP